MARAFSLIWRLGLLGLLGLLVVACNGEAPAGGAVSDSLTVQKPGRVFDALPDGPRRWAAGYQLVLDYEVGGGRPFYEARLSRPTWPGYASGVTWAVGYDGGQTAPDLIAQDWRSLPERDLTRLVQTSGITGRAARPVAAALHDIVVGWGPAEGVFNAVTIPRFWQLTCRTFPGVERLHPRAQWALLSLVYNRGGALKGPRRAEMRRIRELVPLEDYPGIARELRAMPRLWEGSDIERGMRRRRYAEAAMVEGRGSEGIQVSDFTSPPSFNPGVMVETSISGERALYLTGEIWF